MLVMVIIHHCKPIINKHLEPRNARGGALADNECMLLGISWYNNIGSLNRYRDGNPGLGGFIEKLRSRFSIDEFSMKMGESHRYAFD